MKWENMGVRNSIYLRINPTSNATVLELESTTCNKQPQYKQFKQDKTYFSHKINPNLIP